MSKIKLTLPEGISPVDGKYISFSAPCDCGAADAITINGVDYELLDTCQRKPTGAWTPGSLVSVVLDCTNKKAYIQGSSYTKTETDTLLAKKADTSDIDQIENDVNVLESRMDTFTNLPTGSTSGDAELNDIRVGHDGKVYPNAGSAVRCQINQLKQDLSDKSINLIHLCDDYKVATGVGRTYIEKDGTIVLNGTATANNSIPLTDKSGANLEIELEADTVYTLSGCPAGGGATSFWLDIRQIGSSSVFQRDTGDGITFYVSESMTVIPYIRIASGYVFEDITIRPMLNIGKKVQFESYTQETAIDKRARAAVQDAKMAAYNDMDGGFVNSLLKCGMTYVDNADKLIYGNQTATHGWVDGSNKIDCSTLAVLAYAGIPYEASKYAGNQNNTPVYPHALNILDSEAFTLSYQIAKSYHDKGLGFVPLADGSNLQPGDLLFFAIGDPDSGAFLGITHVEILIAKQCNLQTSPILVTLNCSDGRPSESVVQCNNRLPSFWQGRLPYAVRLSRADYKVKNNVDYSAQEGYFVDDLYLEVPQYHCVTLKFTGTLSKVSHFAVKINGTYRMVTDDIPSAMIGKPIEYTVVMANTWSDGLHFEIVTADTGGVIKHARVADGCVY